MTAYSGFPPYIFNGVEAGGRPYGYVLFDVDLNPALKYGQENTLAVKVDNTKGGGNRWYSGAGIYRQVRLSVNDKVFIPRDGITVTLQSLDSGTARVSISAETVNKSGKNIAGELKGRIKAPGGNQAALEFRLLFSLGPAESSAAETEVEIKKPIRWDIDDPALYGLSLCLGEDETVLCFGLREARFDGEEGFFLNGRSRKLKGVNLHHDGGAMGAAVPPAIWKRRLGKLKECGVNAIRCSRNPQAAEFYDLAQEYDGAEDGSRKSVFPVYRRVSMCLSCPSISIPCGEAPVGVQSSHKEVFG